MAFRVGCLAVAVGFHSLTQTLQFKEIDRGSKRLVAVYDLMDQALTSTRSILNVVCASSTPGAPSSPSA